MTVGRANPWLWLGAPALACAFAQILFATPMRILGLSPPEPIFAFVAAFAWAGVDSLIAPLSVIFLGLFLDLLLGARLGLWPLCLLIAYAVAFGGRALMSGQAGATHLAWYLAALAAAFATAFALTAAQAGVAPNLVSVASQYLASAALFPFAWRLGQGYQEADARFR